MDSTPYFDELRRVIASKGGLSNAHLHLDRAGTLLLPAGNSTEDISSLSLAAKHGLISAIHSSDAYDEDKLISRGALYIEKLLAAGTTHGATFVDVTEDRVGSGALRAFLNLKHRYAGKIALEVATYNPLGFKKGDASAWNLFAGAAKDADFIGSLPERDDRKTYPDNIGFEEHCSRVVSLGLELNKSVHIQVDQRNDPEENGTERLIEVLRNSGFKFCDTKEPQIWLIHMISPSSYDELRFRDLLSSLVDLNVGVICCPSAAVSMRQLRPLQAPTHNSIARVLEILAAGIHVRLGSDNICDITSPAGTCDLVNEVFMLANALRYYDIDVLSSVAAGHKLDAHQRARVASHLTEDQRQVGSAIGALI